MPFKQTPDGFVWCEFGEFILPSPSNKWKRFRLKKRKTVSDLQDEYKESLKREPMKNFIKRKREQCSGK